MNARVIICLFLFPALATAQGFAGLGTDGGGYAQVTRPAGFVFPRDHAAHPNHRIEWWYLTANLTDAEGRDYGMQWTLFRQAIRPQGTDAHGWDSAQIWMAHAALTTPERHFTAERFARGGIGQAGVRIAPFEAWIDDWAMTGTGPGFEALAVNAAGEGFAYALDAATDQDPVPQGENGYSVKSEKGTASYYYSQPFLEVEGTLTIEGHKIAVTGAAWIDREWSSQPLEGGQEGWDWFSLHLEDGSKLMAFRLRSGDAEPYLSGTWITPDGRPTPLARDEIMLSPQRETEVAGRDLPTSWRIEVPGQGLAVDTVAVNAQSWMPMLFPYWEGPIRITGSHEGRGYLEMTGYE